MSDKYPIILETITVSELHAQLQSLIDQGLGELPIRAYDGIKRFPFVTHAAYNRTGYPFELLITVRPDAQFPTPPSDY